MTRVLIAAGLAGLLGLGFGPARALEVVRSRAVAAPPAAVWALVGDFCAIALWHPEVARCIRSGDGDGDLRVPVRGLVTTGDRGTIVEVETARDERGMSYSYSFVQGPLPVSAYNATLAVRPDGAGAVVVWSATFDARGMSDAGAEADIAGVFDAGLAGIARELGR